MMTIMDQAREIRKMMEAVSQIVPEEKAANFVRFFPKWEGDGRLLTTGTRIQYNGLLYTVLQGHQTQPNWPPDRAHSLFAKVLTSEDPNVLLPWEQPDSTNPYSKGDRVIHNDHIWESLVDGNVWEPGQIGTETLWQIVEV